MDTLVFYSLLWALVSFYMYWPLFYRVLIKNKVRAIVLTRFYGSFLFGGIPVLYVLLTDSISFDYLGFQFPEGEIVWHLLAFLFMLCVVPLSYIQAKNLASQKDFPQIRETRWDSKLILINSISWMLYLVGYEILFRGLLVFPMLELFSVKMALAINLIIYSLSHVAKNFKEGIGTIPIGLILFLIAWKTNSILYPVIIHWIMALSNSLFSVHHNSTMHFVKNRTA